MKQILKYKLEPLATQRIKMKCTNILSAINQNDSLVVYAMCDNSMRLEKDIEFLIIATGQIIGWDNETNKQHELDTVNDIEENYNFLNTVKILDYVFHVFYRNTWV
jgi:hypothetical protein